MDSLPHHTVLGVVQGRGSALHVPNFAILESGHALHHYHTPKGFPSESTEGASRASKRNNKVFVA